MKRLGGSLSKDDRKNLRQIDLHHEIKEGLVYSFTSGIYDVYEHAGRGDRTGDQRSADPWNHNLPPLDYTTYEVFYNLRGLNAYIVRKLTLIGLARQIVRLETKYYKVLKEDREFSERRRRMKNISNERKLEAQTDITYAKWGLQNLIKKVML